MDEGVNVFETAGNNRECSVQACVDGLAGPLIKLIQTYESSGSSVSSPPKRYIIHKCVSIRHALSGQRMGVDCLSIDGFECERFYNMII